MKLVYIIGPFTASTAWEVEQNVRRAEEAALFVANCGAMPVCSHTNTRFFHGTLTSEFWYAGTMELLLRCDAAFAVGDITNSVGSQREIDKATRKKLNVFYSRPDLKNWIKST